MASKFWEHFLYIAHAMNNRGDDEHQTVGRSRMDSFTTCCICPMASQFPMKVRSMVGLIPLFAVETLEPEVAGSTCPDFKRRMEWFIDNRPDLTQNVACMRTPGNGERRLLSIVEPGSVAQRAASSCWTRTNSFRRTAFARFRVTTRTTPTC